MISKKIKIIIIIHQLFLPGCGRASAFPMEGLLPKVVGGCSVASPLSEVDAIAVGDAFMLEPGIW